MINRISTDSIFFICGNSILRNNKYINNTVADIYGTYFVRCMGNEVTSVNETFIGNKFISSYIAYYDSNRHYAKIIIENITLKNNYAKNDGVGLAIKTGKIKGAKFIYNTALNNGRAIIILAHYQDQQLSNCILEDIVFENNSKDIFIETPYINFKNGQLENITVTFNNLITPTLQNTVTANITHSSGAIIGGGMITFNLNGSYMGVAEVINGVAKLDYLGFTKDGNYSLNGSYNYETNNTIYNNAVVTVILNPLKENITLYVSDIRGDDENGNGSYENPYKTIKTTLNNGYKQSGWR